MAVHVATNIAMNVNQGNGGKMRNLSGLVLASQVLVFMPAWLLPGTIAADTWEHGTVLRAERQQSEHMARLLNDSGAMLAIRCHPDGLDIVLRFDETDFGFAERRAVALRFDGQATVAADWINLDEGGAVLAGPTALQVIDRLRRHNEVLVDDAGHQTRFDLTGAEAALKTFAQDCPHPIGAKKAV
jgi:hypothetical protein